VLYSTYRNILSSVLKNCVSVFRTDSQHKYESCLNGQNNIEKFYSSNGKRKHSSTRSGKLLDAVKHDNLNFRTKKDNINGLNFETMEVVNLELNANETIGITLVNEYNNSIRIARVIKGQAADKSGLLRVNDEIFEVNDEPVKGMDVEEVINAIEEQKKTGSISFLICHESCNKKHKMFDNMAIDKPFRGVESFWIRSQYSYISKEDPFIPCVKIGLDFSMGDVLQIVSKDDHHYWQAKKAIRNISTNCEFEEKVGLIPSKMFRVQCQSVKAALMAEDGSSKLCIGACGCRKLLRRNSDNSTSVFFKDTNNQKKIYKNKKYHYLDTKSFEKAIAFEDIISFKKKRNVYSGILVDSIKQISRSGKVCIFYANEKCIHSLIKTHLKPFIILLIRENLTNFNNSIDNSNPSIEIDEAKEKKLKRKNEKLQKYIRPFVDSCLFVDDPKLVTEQILKISKIITQQGHWITLS
ncbi:hypothetical protein HZS_3474, partial [Henneguya salminicola]